MAGRRSSRHAYNPLYVPGMQRPSRRFVPILVAVVLVVVGCGATAFALNAGSQHAGGQSACSGEVSLPVIAAPTVEAAVGAVAHDWDASHPSVRGHCVRAVVSGQDPAVATRSLASSTRPVLWIPDSTLWSEKLAAHSPALARAVKVDASIGTSPLVIVATPGQAPSVTPAAKDGWMAALNGSTQVTVTNPTTTAAGALIALDLSAQNGSSPGGNAKLVGLFNRLQAQQYPDADAGVTALATMPGMSPPFVASEQDVFLANRGRPTPVVSAVYPSGATPMLNFPMVRVAPAGSNPVVTAAMTRFERQLTTTAARARLAHDGLRGPSGAPLPADTARGISPERIKPARVVVTAQQQSSALRLWSDAAEPSQLLAAIDVSGSMSADSGDGQSKIQVVKSAVEDALNQIPANWTFGLWTFSQHNRPENDWTQLVPLGPVSSQRNKLIEGAAILPDSVGGNTGLYDTALAAYQDVSSHYKPGSVNVVVLLTDGVNDDPDAITLHTLVDRLKAEYNPAKPVRIVTIGVGTGVDASALRSISQATHGQSYFAQDPKSIYGVILDSIIANNASG